MTTSINSTIPYKITPPSSIDEARFDVKREDLIKPSKPELDSHYNSKEGEIIPTAVIFARMMDNMQLYAQSTAEPALLRHAQVGKKIQKTSQEIRNIEHQLIDTKQTIETWESRTRIANYALNAVATLTGIGLFAAGDAWTGGSLIASGLGGGASSLMSSYGWNSTFTSAVSLVSGLIGIVGTAGSVATQLYNHGPMGLLNAIGDTQGSFAYYTKLAGGLATTGATALSGYSTMEKNNQSSTLSQYNAFHTQKTSERQLLEPKLASAATSHQGTAKSMATACKRIVSAQNRFTRDAMRMLTADFPA